MRQSRWTAFAFLAAGALGSLAACSTGGDPQPAAVDSSATSSTTAPGDATTGGPDTSAAAEPFDGDTQPDVSTVREGTPVLVSVTQGEHDGYRRYVFTFREHARPTWDVRYVPGSQAVMDGSGDPVANAGANAHLRITFQADMHDAEGRSTLERSVGDEPPDLVFGGDFENQVTWFYGAADERPFRVFYVGEGRVAVDIAR